MQRFILAIATAQSVLMTISRFVFYKYNFGIIKTNILIAISLGIYVLHLVSYLRKSPLLYRITFQIWAIRSLMVLHPPITDWREEDTGNRLEWQHYHQLGLFCSIIVPTCLCEQALLYVPLTFIYQSCISLSMVADYFETSGQVDHYNYIYQNKLSSVIKVTLINELMKYIVVFYL